MTTPAGNPFELFAAYLATKKVLIADPHGPSRSGLAKLIVTLGAKTNNLILTGGFEDARKAVESKKPELIVSEYTLHGGDGLNLAQVCQKILQTDQKVFAMITSNSSQSVVAQAAEEDVDIYVLKPYTIKNLSKLLIDTVLTKIYPSEYLQLIAKGKSCLAASQADQAIEAFNAAIQLNPKPSLALYYRGQAELLKSLLNGAEDSYQAGLKFNDIHYKCITGLFDLLMNQNRKTDAYEVVKKIAQVFPANPRRLTQVLTLAVQTGNLTDIESYYEAFQTVETRSDELVKYITAALVVTGKHFFNNGEIEHAISILNKAAVSAAGKPQILREIISIYLENDRLDDAKAAFSRFPAAAQGERHYLVAAFMLTQYQLTDASLWLKLCRETLEKIDDPVVHLSMIQCLRTLGKNDEAESHSQDIIKKWPELSKELAAVE